MARVLLLSCLLPLVWCECVDSPIISIQLKWLQQTQFAGYIVAQELGLYADECLTVSIRPGGPSITVEDEVLEGRAHFGNILEKMCGM